MKKEGKIDSKLIWFMCIYNIYIFFLSFFFYYLSPSLTHFDFLRLNEFSISECDVKLILFFCASISTLDSAKGHTMNIKEEKKEFLTNIFFKLFFLTHHTAATEKEKGTWIMIPFFTFFGENIFPPRVFFFFCIIFFFSLFFRFFVCK